jgi:hypothetical protein
MNEQLTSFTGDHFFATLHNGLWYVMQIDPRVFVCTTVNQDLAIEIVNRLDVTGEVAIGQDDTE